ncbi:MAG: hypothetical protein L3K11_07405 [Thermoplasmata archaeon]|nr:hypothetical protein [Thermoplasmata archaeon]
MKISPAGSALVVVSLAMFVCVFLLTPLSGFETRPLPSIHPIGAFTLVLVFAAAALDAVALVLLGRRARLSALLASLGVFLVLPGFVLDQFNWFSVYPPPPAIRTLEYILLAIQAAAFLVAMWLIREQ